MLVVVVLVLVLVSVAVLVAVMVAMVLAVLAVSLGVRSAVLQAVAALTGAWDGSRSSGICCARSAIDFARGADWPAKAGRVKRPPASKTIDCQPTRWSRAETGNPKCYEIRTISDYHSGFCNKTIGICKNLYIFTNKLIIYFYIRVIRILIHIMHKPRKI